MATSGVTGTISPLPARVGRPPYDPQASLDPLRAWCGLLVEFQPQAECKGGCPRATLAGELAEAYADCRTDLAQSFDQWEASIRDGLRAMHQRGDLRRSSGPDRLDTALFAAIHSSSPGFTETPPPSRPHPTRCSNTSHRSGFADVRLRHNCFSDRGRALPPSGSWPERGDLLRRSLHASSRRLVPKAAKASQGRAGQLLCGAIAGPLFASAFTAIGATRAGYNWERLPVNSLAIGRHGWLQRMNFVVAGVLYYCAGGGLRRSANRRVGPRAVPALVAGVGVGLIGSGMFVTDPVGGFPPRTPGGASLDDAGSGTTAPTPAGRLHNLFAIPVFAGIPIAAMASAATAVRSRGLPLGWLLGGVRPRHGREFRYVRQRLC